MAGGGVLEVAARLTLPRMISRRRQADATECRSEWECFARTFDCAQDSLVLRPVRQPAIGKCHSEDLQENDDEAKHRDEPRIAASKRDDLSAQCLFARIHHIETDHLRRRAARPIAGGGWRDAVPNCQLGVAGLADQLLESVVVGTSGSSCSHSPMIRAEARGATALRPTSGEVRAIFFGRETTGRTRADIRR